MARKQAQQQPQVVLQSYASIPIDLLEPHPDNPHKGDSDVIAQSIGANGFYGAVIAQASSKRIIAGHHRVEAARKEGLKEVPVLLLDVDDVTAKRIMLADNRTAEYGHYDDAALAAVLSTLPTIEGTGWTADDFADLDAALAIDASMLEEPLAPPRPRVPDPLTTEPVRPGDPGAEFDDSFVAGPDEDEDDEGSVGGGVVVAGITRAWAVIVSCESEEQRDELAARLEDEGLSVRAIG
ncbi:ParB N-terminal domain-containing protein [Nonomuraea sp. LPB2021202275-12-8]|uniref:ParB N-terminal domain-containing protein n=1 Tax=Nonomuraea sp. LPB2021202275-12-8 TaxID=3120159 RepID=UPI00300CAE6C